MMTTEFIQAQFKKVERAGNRWQFEPLGDGSGLNTHRYFLSFLPPERRFVLARMKVMPFETVADEELVSAFRGTLSEKEIAACMRVAMAPPDDDLPF